MERANILSFIEDLPSEKELFDQIMLTNLIIWNNKISHDQVDSWLDNFKGVVYDVKYERKLALWLLANFVFYNHDEVKHLCNVLYRKFLHTMLVDLYKNDITNIERGIESILHSSRFYFLGSPGESGSLILYYFRQVNNLRVVSFTSDPRNLPDEVKTIVFIDDVTLTGSQAMPYINRQTKNYDEEKNKILLTFFSTKDAINILESNHIRVISCVLLDDRSRSFSNTSSIFHHFNNHLKPCKKFAEEYGRKLYPSDPLGFGNGAYLFGFYYNTPDNTLPIFWAEKCDWHPIVKRYEKKYDYDIVGGIYNEYEGFI